MRTTFRAAMHTGTSMQRVCNLGIGAVLSAGGGASVALAVNHKSIYMVSGVAGDIGVP